MRFVWVAGILSMLVTGYGYIFGSPDSDHRPQNIAAISD